MKNGDEHRGNILQEIFRLSVLEKLRVLFQFVGDLVDDETAAWRESIIGFPKERAFLLYFQNTEGNTRQDVITLGKAAPLQLKGQGGSVSVNHVYPWIMRELPLQIPSERRVQLKQEQMLIRRQASRDLARVHAFTRTVFCNHSRLAEIHLAGDAFHHCF